MKKKISFIRIIDIVYWLVVIIMAFTELYNGRLKDFSISDLKNINFQMISISQYIIMILILLLAILITMFFSMFKIFYVTVIYFGIKIASRKYNKDRLEKVDLKNDNYYREILPKYSPAVLSYIDDFRIDKEDIVATILMLELKGKIKIVNDDIVFLEDTTEQLEENEKYILNKLKEGNFKNINMLEYTNVVRNDALKAGLLEEKQHFKRNIKRKVITNIVIYVLAILSFIMIINLMTMNDTISSIAIIIFFIVLVILAAFIVFMPFIAIVYINHYKMLNVMDPYVRNKEGKQINIKLEGLKNI